GLATSIKNPDASLRYVAAAVPSVIGGPCANLPAAWPPDFRHGRVGSEPGMRRPAPDREPVTRWPVPLPSLAKLASLARRVRAQMVRAGSYEAEIDAARRERPRRLRWQARGSRRAPRWSPGRSE